MKMQVCTVFDTAAGVFGRPIFTASVGQAIRSFQDEVSREAPDNVLNKHPEDFQLYHLGAWDDQSGAFEPLVAPERLTTGKEMVR